jgi:hypothetical protein
MGLSARHAARHIHTDDVKVIAGATVIAVEKRPELLEHGTVNGGSTHREETPDGTT